MKKNGGYAFVIIILVFFSCKKGSYTSSIKEDYRENLSDTQWILHSINYNGILQDESCIVGAKYYFNKDSIVLIENKDLECKDSSWSFLNPQLWYIDEDFNFVIQTKEHRNWSVAYHCKIVSLTKKVFHIKFRTNIVDEVEFVYFPAE